MGKRLGVLLLCLLFTGCASIVSTNLRQVALTSNPAGAAVTITDEKGLDIFNGTTPTTVTLKTGESYFHGKSYTVLFKKSGFEDKTVIISNQINGWYWGNILLGGVIGMLIVDPITGNMFTLSTDNVNATLSQKTSEAETPALHILSLNEVPRHLRNKLVQIN